METCERFESYYSILGVATNSSIEEIRRAYRKLAMQWHPDKWAAAKPSLLAEAKRKFQKIQEAYSVLSDPGTRRMYDAGMYDPYDEQGFCDFVGEMVSLMSQVKEEEKQCSMEDLQNMFADLAQSFASPEWNSSPIPPVSDPTASCQSRLNWQTNPLQTRTTRMYGPDFGMPSGISSFCR